MAPEPRRESVVHSPDGESHWTTSSHVLDVLDAADSNSYTGRSLSFSADLVRYGVPVKRAKSGCLVCFGVAH